MARFEGKQFKGERIVLDDNIYVRCKFTDCMLAFAGGAYSMIECGIDGTFSLSLEGHSANTLQLLQMLSGNGAAAKNYVIGLLDPRNTVDSSKTN